MDQQIHNSNASDLSGNLSDPKKIILNRWAESLTAQKITPADIVYTLEKLTKEGEKEDSARNVELREVGLAIEEFQRKLPPEQLEKLEQERLTEAQKGSPSVQLPSMFNTTIYRKDFLPSQPRVALPGHQFFTAIKTRFPSPTVGQGIKTAVQGIGQKGLQVVGGSIKKGTAAILAKAGLHAAAATVSAGIGNIIIVVAPKLLKAGSSLIKNTVGWVSSGFGLFTAFTEGLTGQREVPENKDLKFLLPVLGCLAGIVFFLPILITNNIIGGAFIVPPSLILYSTRYVGPFPPEVISPACVDGPNPFTDIFGSAAQAHCVPAALLMAISQLECGRAWSLDCKYVSMFLSENWQEQVNQVNSDEDSEIDSETLLNLDCCYNNYAGAAGPMQFTKPTWEDTWGKGNPIGEDPMNRCRIDFAIEAAAIKLKTDSGTDASNCGPWDEALVRKVAKSYCGSCGTSGCQWSLDNGYTDSCSSRCGTDYCGGVWFLYEQYANQ